MQLTRQKPEFSDHKKRAIGALIDCCKREIDLLTALKEIGIEQQDEQTNITAELFAVILLFLQIPPTYTENVNGKNEKRNNAWILAELMEYTATGRDFLEHILQKNLFWIPESPWSPKKTEQKQPETETTKTVPTSENSNP